jgi:hypothetical protein
MRTPIEITIKGDLGCVADIIGDSEATPNDLVTLFERKFYARRRDREWSFDSCRESIVLVELIFIESV